MADRRDDARTARRGRDVVRARRYLSAAVCIAVCTVMLLPLLASVLASVKPTAEAAQTPPTYVPHGFSLDAYRRLWEYQSGLPTYLFNSFGTAVLTVLFSLVLTTLAGYGLARFPVPFKEPLFVVLLLALIIPYQALLTPIFLMFSDLGLTNSLIGLAIIHTAIQLPFSLYIMRNSFEAVPRELEEAAMIDGANSAPDPAAHLHPGGGAGHHHRRPVRLHHVVERVPRCARDDEHRRQVHPPADPVGLAHRDLPRRDGLGDAAGRGDHLDRPVRRHLPAPAAVLRRRVPDRSGEVTVGGAPVVPSRGRLRPLGLGEVEITGGAWAARQEVNADATLAHCHGWMERLGWVANFTRAADGTIAGRHEGMMFADSDVFKLMEAMAWEVGRTGSPDADARFRQLTSAIAPAQEADGYLNTVFGRDGQRRATPTSNGVTSCTTTATCCRRPWPGRARRAPTSSSPRPAASPTTSATRSGRAGSSASAATPRSSSGSPSSPG